MTMTAPRARIARSIASLVALALVSACNPGQTPDPAERSPAAGPSAASPADGAKPTDPVPTSSPAPVIASDEATFDFGTITPDGSVVHVFKLVNRGTADLHIERVERT